MLLPYIGNKEYQTKPTIKLSKHDQTKSFLWEGITTMGTIAIMQWQWEGWEGQEQERSQPSLGLALQGPGPSWTCPF